MNYRYFSIFGFTILLTACSMSGLVQSYSVDYSTAMEQFSNQDILTNLLRARDGAPLHFAELSQVTGSIQVQAQLSTTAYFGQNLRAGKSADQIVPSLSFNSSPTFNVSPLDTEAFSVGILQPIDSSFIAMYWNSGNLSKELVFDLFVSSIENSNNCRVAFYPSVWSMNELKNDPGAGENAAATGSDAEQIKAERAEIKKQNCIAVGDIKKPFPSTFEDYVRLLIKNNVRLKTMTVMVPLGSPFSGVFKGNPLIKPTDLKDLADETSTHLGRVSDGSLQIYRRWDDQLALCVDTDKVVSEESPERHFPEGLVYPVIARPNKQNPPRAPAPSSAPVGNAASNAATMALDLKKDDLLEKLTADVDASKVGAVPKTPKAPKQPAQAQKQGTSSATAQLPTSAVTLIGMLSQRACRQQELIVSPEDSEDEAAENSGGALQIQVRSVQGVVEYIGKTLRLLKFDEKTGAMTWRGDGGQIFFRLFRTREDAEAKVAVRVTVKDADGQTYFAGTPTDGVKDYTMQVLALLNSLINSNKVSSDIPTTKQVQVIP